MVVFREVLALLLLSLACCCCAGSLTPLIAWSNSNALSSVRLQQSPSVAALLDQSDLNGLGLLVVFKTDQLSFDDIVKYAGVYGDGSSALANLQGFMKGSRSSVWGGVDGYPAIQLTDSLSQRLNVQPHKFGVEKLTVDSKSPKLVVVDLPSASGEEGFAKQDAKIAEVMGGVSELNTPYIAFYTADGFVPQENSQEVPNTRARRSLVERTGLSAGASSSDCAVSVAVVRNATSSGNNLDYCLLFCLADNTVRVNLTMESNNSVSNCSVNIYSEHFNGGACLCEDFDNATCLRATVPIEEAFCPYLDIPNGQVDITFLFHSGINQTDPLKADYWRMDIYLNETYFYRDRPNPNLFTDFAVPKGTSYACSGDTSLNTYSADYNSTTVLGPEDDTTPTIKSLHLPGIQVQAFGQFYVDKRNGHPVFASAYNCHGYFKLSSWMGIFSVVILSLVLYISIVFAFSIQTQDRFDDPRGPTITIENLH